jgi:hypothetical protein
MKFKTNFHFIVVACFCTLMTIAPEANAQYRKRKVASAENTSIALALPSNPSVLLKARTLNFLQPTYSPTGPQQLKIPQAYQPYSLEKATQFYKNKKEPMDFSSFVYMGYSIASGRPLMRYDNSLPDRSISK